MPSLPTTLCLLLSTITHLVLAAPVADPHRGPGHHQHRPPITLTFVVEEPTDLPVSGGAVTPTVFNSLTNTNTGFAGPATGASGSATCEPTFSIMSGAAGATPVPQESGAGASGSNTLTLQGARVATLSGASATTTAVAKRQVSAASASASITAAASITNVANAQKQVKQSGATTHVTGVMTTSGDHSGMWMVPTACAGGAFSAVNSLSGAASASNTLTLQGARVSGGAAGASASASGSATVSGASTSATTTTAT